MVPRSWAKVRSLRTSFIFSWSHLVSCTLAIAEKLGCISVVISYRVGERFPAHAEDVARFDLGQSPARRVDFEAYIS
jgi:hypothetical protein